MNFKAMPTTATTDMISAAYMLLETLPLDTPERQRRAIMKIWKTMADAAPLPDPIRAPRRQQQVYEVIADFINDNGRVPTYDEIGALVKMHKSQVHACVKSLRKRGYLTYREGHTKSIKLLGAPERKG